MSRIKHPIRAIREPFGTAGLVVACIALIAALGGTALAAKGAFTGKQKKEIAKIAKKEAQKYANSNPGAPGAPGTNGTNGAPGEKGAKGDKGDPGTNGEDGKSVVVNSFSGGSEPAGEPCNGQGGNEIEVEGSENPTYACNGKEGSPWTAGGTLPKGQTETGVYGTYTVTNAITSKASAITGVSFDLPLKTPPTVGYINTSEEELTTFNNGTESWEYGTPQHCMGSVSAPTAPEGYLCIYARGSGLGTEPAGGGVANAFSVGAILEFEKGFAGLPISGTWAVTSKE